jgi:hypothetical protein
MSTADVLIGVLRVVLSRLTGLYFPIKMIMRGILCNGLREKVIQTT